ncbi:MAG: DSD1 family PLP-dependent enzyme [Rhodospirillaceae bacterium]|nr:DSD1 family PLP-dependent enzyme [Rhodospirillaceae bacterium]
MAQPRPDISIGDPAALLDTPVLVVDLDVFEANLQRMADFAAAKGIRLRPHGKTHKCSAIGRRQMVLGAAGLCCQKVSEAEAFVAGGIADVLVTNEVLAPRKLERLARLTAQARIGICVDSLLGLDRLIGATEHAARPIDAYLELDVGAARCGVVEIGDAQALVERIAAAPGLSFGGIQAYHGGAQHLRTPAEREAAIAFASGRARDLVAALAQRGIATPVVTGAGTGTFPIEAASGVYNEIQPGSYIFMDRDYGDNQWSAEIPPFGNSLFVLTEVISRREDFAVVDAGLKAQSLDSGFPVIAGRPDLRYDGPSDEHGTIRGANLPRLTERLALVPGHCDPTVNLYDWIVGIRDGMVAEIWPVDARGALI